MATSILSFLLHVLFMLALLAGIVIIPFGLPGTFVIAGLALIHALLTGFVPLSGSIILLLFALAAVGEIVEFFLGAATARKFGGSKPAMWGAILGCFAGAVFATGVMPVVGTLIGAFAGAFAGAFLFEYLHIGNSQRALRVGFGAFLGALGGKLMKIAIGIAMTVIIGYTLF